MGKKTDAGALSETVAKDAWKLGRNKRSTGGEKGKGSENCEGIGNDVRFEM
jgi:hypothetical protein